MKNPKKTITLILSPFLSVLIFFVLFKVNMTAKEVKPTFKTFPQNKDGNLIYYNESKSLTHQLLKLELDYKLITPNQYELARKNINDYLETASVSCAQFLTNSRKFITCANNELGAYFPYKDSVDIGSNLSSHQSDCDSNVYLLHDIASRNGIKSRIRYLPEHALLWFRDNRGKENFYWETTAYENTGDIADFKNPKYLFSTESFYKTLYDNNDVIKIYPVLLLGILPKDLTNKIIEDKSPLIMENPIRKEFYYWNLKGLSAVDINALLKLKNKTPSSSNINLILSRHYLKENNLLLSSNYLHDIAPYKCKTMCLNIDAEINDSKTKRYFVRFLFSIFNIPDNIENQKKIIKYSPFIILIETIILILLFSSSLLKKYSINRDS